MSLPDPGTLMSVNLLSHLGKATFKTVTASASMSCQ